VKLVKNAFFYHTPLGKIALAETGSMITNLFFAKDIFLVCELRDRFIVKETEILNEAALQLEEYFKGRRKSFDIPLQPSGTEFMLSVWKELSRIPYGETRSYKDIAEAIGNPKACRAVGQANNRNPIPIFIPCHRVIGSSGSLVGYASGIEIKRFLLDLEKQFGFGKAKGGID